MTGEITLRGLVLPVGGIKEKVLAAHRGGIKRVIMPARNEKDLQDIPANVRKEMEFVFAKRVDEVLAAAREAEGYGTLHDGPKPSSAAPASAPAQPRRTVNRRSPVCTRRPIADVTGLRRNHLTALADSV